MSHRHEFEQAPVGTEGQESWRAAGKLLVAESDTTKRLNNKLTSGLFFSCLLSLPRLKKKKTLKSEMLSVKCWKQNAGKE